MGRKEEKEERRGGNLKLLKFGCGRRLKKTQGYLAIGIKVMETADSGVKFSMVKF
jgi:hypothetical protein